MMGEIFAPYVVHFVCEREMAQGLSLVREYESNSVVARPLGIHEICNRDVLEVEASARR